MKNIQENKIIKNTCYNAAIMYYQRTYIREKETKLFNCWKNELIIRFQRPKL